MKEYFMFDFSRYPVDKCHSVNVYYPEEFVINPKLVSIEEHAMGRDTETIMTKKEFIALYDRYKNKEHFIEKIQDCHYHIENPKLSYLFKAILNCRDKYISAIAELDFYVNEERGEAQ